MRFSNTISYVLLLGLLAATGCSGNMTDVRADSLRPRAGNVYVLRGWIGVFSTGMDGLNGELNASGVRAHIYQDLQWHDLADTILDRYAGQPNPEPLVLVGHSYGADDAIRVARVLNERSVKVDLLVTFDPVTPLAVPPNVTRAINMYQSNAVTDGIPILRGIPIQAESAATEVINDDIRTDPRGLASFDTNHINIDKNAKVHRLVVMHILDICPPREQWDEHVAGGEPDATSASGR